jgi:hypothetical protein
MTVERWTYAQEKRPWLANYLDQVFETLRRGPRHQDPLNLHKYKYYYPISGLEPEYNHLVVVALFKRQMDEAGRIVSNNYVVNVWAVFIYSQR